MKGTLLITSVTIEAGWKTWTMRQRWGTGPGRYVVDPNTPADMVDKVIAKSRDVHDLVQQLNILGHGSAKGMQIGSHFVELDNVKNYKASFLRLRNVLSGESFVHLMGCTVGQNEELLVELA
jgi:hypothetical protein